MPSDPVDPTENPEAAREAAHRLIEGTYWVLYAVDEDGTSLEVFMRPSEPDEPTLANLFSAVATQLHARLGDRLPAFIRPEAQS